MKYSSTSLNLRNSVKATVRVSFTGIVVDQLEKANLQQVIRWMISLLLGAVASQKLCNIEKGTN